MFPPFINCQNVLLMGVPVVNEHAVLSFQPPFILKHLSVKKMLKILPPSYSAVGFSDTKTYIAFVEADGVFSDHTSDNEEISARFYSREEVKALLETQEFSSRSQMAAFFFTEGAELWNKNDPKQEDEDK